MAIQGQFAFGGSDHAGNHIEEGRFHASTGSNDADKLILLDRKIDLGESSYGTPQTSLKIVNA